MILSFFSPILRRRVRISIPVTKIVPKTAYVRPGITPRTPAASKHFTIPQRTMPTQ